MKLERPGRNPPGSRQNDHLSISLQNLGRKKTMRNHMTTH